MVSTIFHIAARADWAAAQAAGAYTAVIEGTGGGTGVALAEAYEVSRDSAKIINLATRGFADRSGREMHGGFVVQGAAGATKRVLIRVLGPSLARAPFNLSGLLDDPELELRNAEARREYLERNRGAVLAQLQFNVVKHEPNAADTNESKVYLSKQLTSDVVRSHTSSRTVVRA